MPTCPSALRIRQAREEANRAEPYGYFLRFVRCGKYESETLFESAVAVEELLCGSKWCLMQFL